MKNMNTKIWSFVHLKDLQTQTLQLTLEILETVHIQL